MIHFSENDKVTIDYYTINAMIKYEGSFVEALGKACQCADGENLKKLKEAFPEYWTKYTELAKFKPEKE